MIFQHCQFLLPTYENQIEMLSRFGRSNDVKSRAEEVKHRLVITLSKDIRFWYFLALKSLFVINLITLNKTAVSRSIESHRFVMTLGKDSLQGWKQLYKVFGDSRGSHTKSDECVSAPENYQCENKKERSCNKVSSPDFRHSSSLLESTFTNYQTHPTRPELLLPELQCE